ncbi:DUF1707 SHOCT-like domain-containing protein [Streptomyces sp. CMB-StM0423]|uniref:DUF1707 SHOCT-like domain-containing protein n=1 Tax=Streptomyces sp. CMB-StM0423 TaxID=2059884 RepID=UPI000C713B08|nr:DUF1707 domain-containing protein [Streptomyces sp. CMB-StM0423]AUH42829.1 hypothetical protein CXR04_23965 [Streptomyces sp. CMB-StM0423]
MTSDEHLPELRASDADRERVADILRDALAEGRLAMDEFEERLEETYRAKTYAQLEPLTRDLPAAGTAPAPRETAPAPRPASGWAGRIGGEATSHRGIAIMSGFQRKGAWTVPRRFTMFSFWGGGELDLREADFEAAEVEIRCISIMGGAHVILPPDLALEVRGIGIMGGFDHSQTGVPHTPGAPRVTLTGFAFWGGVGTSRKKTKAARRAEASAAREQRRLAREERRLSREERRKRLE